MKRTVLFGMTIVLAAAGGLAGSEVHRERIEWCNVWVPDADRADAKRVLLVGDSITSGYYGGVSKALAADKLSVARLTTSRSVCDPMFVDELRPVIEAYEWAVIHFNNGIHGPAYDEARYREGLHKTLQYLKEKCPNAKLIVVLSTPPRPGSETEAKRTAARNRIARRLAEEMNLPVNDLHTPMSGHKDYYRDRYHFHRPAIEMQVRLVVEAVRKVQGGDNNR